MPADTQTDSASWRECETLQFKEKVYDTAGCYDVLLDISSPSSSADSSPDLAKNRQKRGIKGLFSQSNIKLQKSLKRGVYLACVFYCEEKVLVTEEERCIPIIEVNPLYTGTPLHDTFRWLLKLTCQWSDLRNIKQELDQLFSSSVELKKQLLTASLQMQTLFGVQDLGKLHYRPIHTQDGSAVFLLANGVPDIKEMSPSELKWSSVAKLQKNAHPTIGETLLPFLAETSLYKQISSCPLPAGLYLGYLQAKIGMDTLTVFTPQSCPNSLPHIKIRDESHVTKTEWQSLLDLVRKADRQNEPTEEGSTFRNLLIKSSQRLAASLDMLGDTLGCCKIYASEVLQLSENVSFIILTPPTEFVCSLNHVDDGLINKQGMINLPLRCFEMSHLHTYQKEFITAYSLAALHLDTKRTAAQQARREAFTKEETDKAAQRIADMKLCQQRLDAIWKNAQWVTSILTSVRDGTAQGLSLHQLISHTKRRTSRDMLNRKQDTRGDNALSHKPSANPVLIEPHYVRAALQNITGNNNLSSTITEDWVMDFHETLQTLSDEDATI